MARIRTIKPEFFTSLTIASLPLTARLTFVGLWTHVDDEGRCVDDARLVKAAVWPLDDRLSSEVEEDLKALTESSLITRYIVSGRSYIAVNGWDEHQRINRPTKSRIPDPSDADEPAPTSGNAPFMDDSVSTHAQLTEDSLAERNREQGTGNRERNKNSSPSAPRNNAVAAKVEEDFERFWAAYPRREARGAARKAWTTAVRKADADVIVAAAERFRDQPGRDPKYTAHPATWLNAERWADQPAPTGARSSPDGNGYRGPFRNPTDPNAYTEGL